MVLFPVKKQTFSQACCCKPVILAPPKTKAKESQVQGDPGQWNEVLYQVRRRKNDCVCDSVVRALA